MYWYVSPLPRPYCSWYSAAMWESLLSLPATVVVSPVSTCFVSSHRHIWMHVHRIFTTNPVVNIHSLPIYTRRYTCSLHHNYRYWSVLFFHWHHFLLQVSLAVWGERQWAQTSWARSYRSWTTMWCCRYGTRLARRGAHCMDQYNTNYMIYIQMTPEWRHTHCGHHYLPLYRQRRLHIQIISTSIFPDTSFSSHLLPILWPCRFI